MWSIAVLLLLAIFPSLLPAQKKLHGLLVEWCR